MYFFRQGTVSFVAKPSNFTILSWNNNILTPSSWTAEPNLIHQCWTAQITTCHKETAVLWTAIPVCLQWRRWHTHHLTSCLIWRPSSCCHTTHLWDHQWWLILRKLYFLSEMLSDPQSRERYDSLSLIKMSLLLIHLINLNPVYCIKNYTLKWLYLLTLFEF